MQKMTDDEISSALDAIAATIRKAASDLDKVTAEMKHRQVPIKIAIQIEAIAQDVDGLDSTPND